MLYIGRVYSGSNDGSGKSYIQWDDKGWHIGEPLPPDFKSAGIVFQADDEELSIIVESLTRVFQGPNKTE